MLARRSTTNSAALRLLGRGAFAAMLALGLVSPAAAQDVPADPAAEATAGEIEALLAEIEARMAAIDAAAVKRDEALKFLGDQVDKAALSLTTRHEENLDLRESNAALNTQVESLAGSREEVGRELARLSAERDSAMAALTARVAELDRETVELRAAAEGNETLAADLAEAKAGIETREQTIVMQKQEVARLNDEAAALQAKLDEAKAALASAPSQASETLSSYRSEFYGRLRDALGNRVDIRVEGDRFVFQAELLFDSGSARLDPQGEAQLGELAAGLTEIAAEIPTDLDWILRVDGHTDRLPIRAGPIASNWELSAARAISVVEFLVRQGIAPERLAAAGFGEFQPLDARDDEIAYRRNRRIEFRLTQK
ncbi:MAG: OmpA family protein [Dongiaceae bacterium]